MLVHRKEQVHDRHALLSRTPIHSLRLHNMPVRKCKCWPTRTQNEMRVSNYRACRLVNKYLTKSGGYRTTLKRGEIKTLCHLVSSVPAYGVKERAEGLSSSVLLSAIGRRQTCGGKTRVSTRHLPGRDHGAQEHSVQYITVFPDELKWLFDSVRWNFPFRLNRYDSIAAFKPRW